MFHILGRAVYRFRWGIVAVWIVLAVLGAFASLRASSVLKGGGFDIANSESNRGFGVLYNQLHVPNIAFTVVLSSTGSVATDPVYQQTIHDVTTTLQSTAGVQWARVTRTGAGGHVVEVDASSHDSFTKATLQSDSLRSSLPHTGPVHVYLTGLGPIYSDMQTVSDQDLQNAERASLPIALLLLLLIFGSLVAAGMPIIMGLISVTLTLAALYLIGQVTDLSIYALNTASLIGLGVGIDYSLFMVSRFREEMRRDVTVQEAVERTVVFAGRAIFFSGLTVMIGLCSLLLFDLMVLRSMGIAGVIVVFFSMLVALTFLPAMLAILGPRINAVRIAPLTWFRRGKPAEQVAGFSGQSRGWHNLALAVMRHPLPVLFGVLIFTGFLMSPVFKLRLGIPGAVALPTFTQSRQGQDLLDQTFGKASLSPIVLVVQSTRGAMLDTANLNRLAQVSDAVHGQSNVAQVTSLVDITSTVNLAALLAPKVPTGATLPSGATLPPGTKLPPGTTLPAGTPPASTTGAMAPSVDAACLGWPAPGKTAAQQRAALIAFLNAGCYKLAPPLNAAVTQLVNGNATQVLINTVSQPDDDAARTLVGRLHHIAWPAGVSVTITGGTPAEMDWLSSLYQGFPRAIIFVLIITMAALFMLFRSIFLPIKAVIVNLFSIAASYGLVTWVFQMNHGQSILNFPTLNFIDSIVPVVMFCILFGLSMDYEVFLLSRVREEWLETGDNTHSVAVGLERTGQIITSAALVMVIVSGAFAFTNITTIKQLGLGMAVAVGVDATIMRALLVPAAMRLMGRWNWWLPGVKPPTPLATSPLALTDQPSPLGSERATEARR